MPLLQLLAHIAFAPFYKTDDKGERQGSAHQFIENVSFNYWRVSLLLGMQDSRNIYCSSIPTR